MPELVAEHKDDGRAEDALEFPAHACVRRGIVGNLQIEGSPKKSAFITKGSGPHLSTKMRSTEVDSGL
jgi:hypothetical protein